MVRNVTSILFTVFAALLLLLPAPAAAGPDESAVQAFKAWFRDYKKGKVDLYQPSIVPLDHSSDPSMRYVRTEAVRRMDALLKGLVERNDVQAARLLVEAASFRFHRRPEVEIKKYFRQQPWMLRAHALEALRRITNPEAVEWLKLRLVKNDAGWEGTFRKIMALTVLTEKEKSPDRGLILGLVGDRDPRVREKATVELGRTGDVSDMDVLTALLDDRDVRVRVAALEALSRIVERTTDKEPSTAEALLALAAWKLEDPAWPVQDAALSLFSRFRSARSIPLLIKHLDRLSSLSCEGHERVLQRTAAVLRSLTGAFILEPDPALWRDWWEKNREIFTLGPAPKGELEGFQLDVPYFFNIPVDTDAVYFILDISGSMSAPLPQPGKDAGETGSKLDRARKELDRALEAMDSSVRFNLILFNDTIHLFRDAPVPVDRKNLEAAKAFYLKAKAEGGTNLFDALNSAFGIQSMGLVDRFDDRLNFDTIFLLSDGVPTTGLVIDPEEILRIISNANAHDRIRINTIYIGTGSGRFMRELARRNFGSFVHVH